MRTEGASAVQMARNLNVLEKADSDRIGRACWSTNVQRWPRGPEPRAVAPRPRRENALARLYTVYESIQPRDDGQRAFLASSLASLQQLGLSRTERLVMARTNAGPPWSCGR